SSSLLLNRACVFGPPRHGRRAVEDFGVVYADAVVLYARPRGGARVEGRGRDVDEGRVEVSVQVPVARAQPREHGLPVLYRHAREASEPAAVEEVEARALCEQERLREGVAVALTLEGHVLVHRVDELRRFLQEVLAEHGLAHCEEYVRGLAVEVFEPALVNRSDLLR